MADDPDAVVEPSLAEQLYRMVFKRDAKKEKEEKKEAKEEGWFFMSLEGFEKRGCFCWFIWDEGGVLGTFVVYNKESGLFISIEYLDYKIKTQTLKIVDLTKHLLIYPLFKTLKFQTLDSCLGMQITLRLET